MDLLQQRKTASIHCLIHRVSFIRNHKVDVSGRVGQGLFPQTVPISRPDPWPVIPFIDYLPKWDSCLLEDSDVIADVHQIP